MSGDSSVRLVELSGRVTRSGDDPATRNQIRVKFRVDPVLPGVFRTTLRLGCFTEDDSGQVGEHPDSVFLCTYELVYDDQEPERVDVLVRAWPLLRTSVVNHSRMLGISFLDILPVDPPMDQLSKLLRNESEDADEARNGKD